MAVLKLVLLRHAEAEDPHGRKDHQRNLTRHGQKEAKKIAKLLAEESFAPDLIITSDAARTLETTAAVVKALKWKAEPFADKRLYLGGLKDIREVVAFALEERDVEATTLLVVGHNPGWSLAAQTLSDVS